MTAEKQKGLFKRNGIWYIDKVVNGRRIVRSTRTRCAVTAQKMLDAEVARVSAIHASEAWHRYVEKMMRDKTSWIYLTVRRAKRRGKNNGKGSTLTASQVRELLLECDGRCTVTSIPFNDFKPAGARVAPFRYSIDRIDSAKGYHFDNCRIVCFAVNMAMREWGEMAVVQIGLAMLKKHVDTQINTVSGSHTPQMRDLEESTSEEK
jgi:hypothetical protein